MTSCQLPRAILNFGTALIRVRGDGGCVPAQEIKITGATTFVNPFKDEEAAEAKKEEEDRIKVFAASSEHACWSLDG